MLPAETLQVFSLSRDVNQAECEISFMYKGFAMALPVNAKIILVYSGNNNMVEEQIPANFHLVWVQLPRKALDDLFTELLFKTFNAKSHRESIECIETQIVNESRH